MGEQLVKVVARALEKRRKRDISIGIWSSLPQINALSSNTNSTTSVIYHLTDW